MLGILCLVITNNTPPTSADWLTVSFLQRSVCSNALLASLTFCLSTTQMGVNSKASVSPFSLPVVPDARKPSLDPKSATISRVHVARYSGCRSPVFQKQVGRLAAHVHSSPQLLV